MRTITTVNEAQELIARTDAVYFGLWGTASDEGPFVTAWSPDQTSTALMIEELLDHTDNYYVVRVGPRDSTFFEISLRERGAA